MANTEFHRNNIKNNRILCNQSYKSDSQLGFNNITSRLLFVQFYGTLKTFFLIGGDF